MVLAILVVERVLFGQSLSTAVVWLGLTRTTTRGFAAGIAIGLLLLVTPVYAVHAGMALKWYPRGTGLLLGLLAQGGVAEEVLPVRPCLREVPFLLLFLSLPWTLASASVALAAATTPPLARLYELGGRSIWPRALVHFVMQGAIIVPGAVTVRLPLIWMLACATLPIWCF